MVAERGYERQIAPGGPQAAVLSDARDFGAGIGEAIAAGGEQLHQRRLRQYKLDRQEAADSEAADVARRFAELRVDNDDFIRQSRTGPVPGAKGHAEAVASKLAEQREIMLDGIVESSVRRAAGVQWDDYAARVTSAEQTYELGRSIDLDIANLKRANDLSENRIVTSKGDPAVYAEELKLFHTSIDLIQNITPEQREALRYEGVQSRTLAHAESQMQADPQGVLVAATAGFYDNVLSPEQVEALKRGSLIKIKADEQERAEAAQDARDAAREKMKILKGRVERLEPVSAKEAEAVFKEAEAAGIAPSDLEAARAAYNDSQRLAPYSAANDPRGDRAARRVAEIDLKRASGAALSPEEQRDYGALQGAATARAKEQGEQRKELYSSGPAGAVQAMEEVATLRDRGQRFAAGQEFGGDAGYVALLPSAGARKVAIDGKAVLKARPKDFGESAQIDKMFAAEVGAIAPSLGPSFGPLKTLSWQIYAGQMNAQGLTGWNEANYRRALRTAFGMTQRSNGVLQGGIGMVRGHRVMLPDDRTADEFDAIISAIPAAKFAEAVYANGSAANKADVLSRYRPEYVGEDARGYSVYNLIGPDARPLRLKTGAAYPIAVPPKAPR